MDGLSFGLIECSQKSRASSSTLDEGSTLHFHSSKRSRKGLSVAPLEIAARPGSVSSMGTLRNQSILLVAFHLSICFVESLSFF